MSDKKLVVKNGWKLFERNNEMVDELVVKVERFRRLNAIVQNDMTISPDELIQFKKEADKMVREICISINTDVPRWTNDVLLHIHRDNK